MDSDPDQVENIPSAEPELLPWDSPHRFCQYCGENVLTEAVVCIHCGRQIRELKTASLAPIAEPVSQGWSAGEMFALYAVACIMPCVAIAIGLWGLFTPGKRSQGSYIIMMVVASSIIWMVILGPRG